MQFGGMLLETLLREQHLSMALSVRLFRDQGRELLSGASEQQIVGLWLVLGMMGFDGWGV